MSRILSTMQISIVLIASLMCSSVLANSIVVEQAWVKESIPGAANGAGYLTLRNESTDSVTLIGVTTPAARASEVHQHLMRDGMMRMRRVPELTIAANETVLFQPGGYHLMMFGVKEPLKVGAMVPFELQFSDGSSLGFNATVKSIRND